MQFWHPCQKCFDHSAIIFRSKSQEDFKKVINFSTKLFFFKMLRWILWMQFWQPCPKFSSHSPKMILKIMIFQKNVLRMFFWTRRMQFWQTCRKFFGKRKILSLSFKSSWKSLFEKIFWLKKPIWTRGNHFWEHAAKSQYLFTQSPIKILKSSNSFKNR